MYRTELKHMMAAAKSGGVRAAMATDYRGTVTHNYGFTDYTALVKPQVGARSKSLDERLAESVKRMAARLEVMGEIGEAAIVKHEDPTFERWMMIHPSIESGWRLTTFASDGFYGHMSFGDKVGAMCAAARDGFYLRDDGALSRMQHTPQFVRGGCLLDLIGQVNTGKISTFEAAAKLVEYDERMNRMAA